MDPIVKNVVAGENLCKNLVNRAIQSKRRSFYNLHRQIFSSNDSLYFTPCSSPPISKWGIFLCVPDKIQFLWHLTLICPAGLTGGSHLALSYDCKVAFYLFTLTLSSPSYLCDGRIPAPPSPPPPYSAVDPTNHDRMWAFFFCIFHFECSLFFWLWTDHCTFCIVRKQSYNVWWTWLTDYFLGHLLKSWRKRTRHFSLPMAFSRLDPLTFASAQVLLRCRRTSSIR